jgi:16S rRNA processing protein RimM
VEEPPPGHVAVGRVATAWSVRGLLKVIPLVDKRQRLAPGRTIHLDGTPRPIESARWHKGHVYLKLAGIDDRETAFALRDRLLTVPESELEPLPEGQYYRFQLIGLTVTTTAGAALGEVTDVITTGANDVYVLHGDRGEVLIPATADVIRQIDLEAGRMLIEEGPGLIPEPN